MFYIVRNYMQIIIASSIIVYAFEYYLRIAKGIMTSHIIAIRNTSRRHSRKLAFRKTSKFIAPVNTCKETERKYLRIALRVKKWMWCMCVYVYLETIRSRNCSEWPGVSFIRRDLQITTSQNKTYVMRT